MLPNLPAPFMVGSMKIWPVHSRPDFSWFLVYQEKPFYFKNKNSAVLFAKDKQAMHDAEGLCD
jgi:hypothetical protein